MIQTESKTYSGCIHFGVGAVLLMMLLIGSASGKDLANPVDIVKAVSIAYSHFEKRIATKYEEESREVELADLARYASDPQNYNIGVSQTGDMYVVVFLLRRTPPYEYISGGGGQYLIRKSDLMIVNFTGYK